MPSSVPPATAAVRAVFFDLDDTLCDAETAFAEAAATAFRPLIARHPRLTEAQIVAEWRALHVPMLADLSAGRRTMAEVRLLRFRLLLDSLGMPYDSFADELDLLLGRTQLGLLKPFEGVPEVLDALRGRGLHVGIVTNGAGDTAHPDSQRSKAEHLGLLGHVDSFFVSNEMGHRKPDPRAFLPALVAAGGADAPHEALFVGDSLDNDVAGANAAGMVSVLLWPATVGGRVTPEAATAFVAGAEPRHVISSVAEVLGLVADDRQATKQVSE